MTFLAHHEYEMCVVNTLDVVTFMTFILKNHYKNTKRKITFKNEKKKQFFLQKITTSFFIAVIFQS